MLLLLLTCKTSQRINNLQANDENLLVKVYLSIACHPSSVLYVDRSVTGSDQDEIADENDSTQDSSFNPSNQSSFNSFELTLDQVIDESDSNDSLRTVETPDETPQPEPEPPKMASSSTCPRESCHKIEKFDGTAYENWRYLTELALGRAKLKALMHDSELERGYVALSPERRATEKDYLDYDAKQDEAKLIVCERLERKFLERVRRLPTVKSILDQMDAEFRTTSRLGLITAREQYEGLRYNPNGDLLKYLSIHESRAQTVIEAGGNLTELDKVDYLHASLPEGYDSVMDWFEDRRDERERTYERYRRKLIEKHERLKRSEGNTKSFKPSQPNSRTSEQQTNPNQNWRSQKTVDDSKSKPKSSVTCYTCGEQGHTARDCPKRAPASNRTVPKEQPATEKEDEVKPTAKADWSKFRQAPRQRPTNTMHVGGNAVLRHIIDGIESENAAFSTRNPPMMMMVRDESDGMIESFDTFLLDTGAEYHMVCDKSMLIEPTELEPQRLSCADIYANLKATHIGNLWIEVKSRLSDEPTQIELQNVLYAPELACNLLSETRITREGRYRINFERDYADVISTETDEVMFSAIRRDDLKFVEAICYRPPSPAPVVMPVSTENAVTDEVEGTDPNANAEPVNEKNDELELWHRRLGHISAKYVRRLQTHALGVPTLSGDDEHIKKCHECLLTKSTRLPHNHTRQRPVRRFEILHSDVLDPAEGTKSKKTQILVITDGFSGYMKTFCLEKKSDVGIHFSRYQKWLTNRFPDSPTHKLRVDNAREFIQGDLELYCQQTGISIDSGSPYSPELNGLAERKNRTLLQVMRALLQESGYEVNLWSYALKTAEYIINRCPTKTNEDFTTPFELVFERKPDLSKLRVFGCLAFVHIPKETRQQLETKGKTSGKIKLGPNAVEKFLIGFTDTGYELYDPVTKKVSVSSDVRFIESETYRNWRTKQLSLQPSSSSAPSIMTLAMVDEEEINSDEEFDEHTNARAILAMSAGINRSMRQTIADFIPKTYQQAVNCQAKDHWIEAIHREFDSHLENESFELVNMPSNPNLVDTKWVFRVKFSEDGDEIAKARLTARGFKDSTEYANAEKYSPVCPSDVIKFVLSLANQRNMEMCALDVTTAFLYGELENDIYARIPQGLSIDPNTKALKLKKAIYGLKVASKRWNESLKSTIMEMGYEQTKIERCLYKMGDAKSNTLTLLITYVDDVLIVSDSIDAINKTVSHIGEKYKIKTVMNPRSFVGLELERNREKRELRISQTKYIRRAAEMFGLTGDCRFATPMEANLSIEKPIESCDDTEYRGLIGAALYIARHSRPDVSFAVNKLASFQGYVSNELKSYARRILRYLYSTSEKKLLYSGSDEIDLRWFVDASYAPDSDCRSVSGYLMYFRGDLVSWGTRKQSLTVTSSTAAEVVAVSDFFDEAKVIRYLLMEVLGVESPIVLHEDNSSAVQLLEDCRNKKQRQLRIRTVSILEAVESGEVTVEQTPGQMQLADTMTKSLDRSKFEKILPFLISE